MLRDAFSGFHDPDGNFIEQFQTTGFDQRTFELYLFAVVSAAGLDVDRKFEQPDFMVTRDGITVCVEAVTANPTAGPKPYHPIAEMGSIDDHAEYLLHEVPIRFGSPLFSKLSKRYWERPHIAGKPFVIAIETFHGDGSLGLSYSELASYLYGLQQHWYHDEGGNLIISATPIASHRHGAKEIPSGFFMQPDAENISAILFSNSGTIPKFGRMGHQGSYRNPNVRMFRFGSCYDYDPNATEPDIFLYEVGDLHGHNETWSEGTVLIHNPNARHPVPEGLLGAAAESRLVEDRMETVFLEAFHPFQSLTALWPSTTSEEFLEAWAKVIVAEMLNTIPTVQAVKEAMQIRSLDDK
jgi:hypothetical protein